ncbi:MAG: GNAT family N-acetyltransferase [Patescibacteria group bacterium]|jgi:hypothetical protein
MVEGGERLLRNNEWMHDYAKFLINGLKQQPAFSTEQLITLVNQTNIEIDQRFNDQADQARLVFVQEFTQATVQATRENLEQACTLLSVGPEVLTMSNGMLARLPIVDQLQCVVEIFNNTALERWHEPMNNHLLNKLDLATDTSLEQVVTATLEQPLGETLPVLCALERLLESAQPAERPSLYKIINSIAERSDQAFLRYACATLQPQLVEEEQPVDLLMMQPDQSTRVSSDYVALLGDYNIIRGLAPELDSVRHYQDVEDIMQDPMVLPFQGTIDSAEIANVFTYLHRPKMRYYLEQTLHLRLDQLSLRSQIQLLNYLTASESNVGTFEATATKPELNTQQFAESFFAATEQPQLADQLLHFAQTFPAEQVNTVLQHYLAIISELNNVEQRIHDFFVSPGQADTVDTRIVVQETLRRANRVLQSAICADQTINFQELQKNLTAIKKDAIIFGAMCWAVLRHQPEVTLEQLRDFSVEQLAYTELSEEYKKSMLAISSDNHPDTPNTVEGLANILSPKTATETTLAQRNRFIFVKHKNKIVSFIRIENRGSEQYLASFNVDKTLRGSGIGEQLGLFALEGLRQDPTVQLISADVFPLQQPIIRYMRAGFVGMHFTIDPTAKGKEAAWIEMKLTQSPNAYNLQKKTIQELLALAEQQHQIDDYTTLAKRQEPTIVLLLDLTQSVASLNSIFQTLLNHKPQPYCLTRYECLDRTCSKRLAGFEIKDVAIQTQTASSVAA